MAELEEQQAEAVSAEVGEKGQHVADQFASADEAADPAPPPSVEEVAASIGWTPKDKFTGPEEKWKPADQFIRDGRKAEKNMKRRLDEMSSTLDNVSKTTAAVLEERLREQRQDLAAQYAAAVEKGDPDEAWKISNEIHALKAPTTVERRGPAPETEEWATRNARVLKDPLAQQRAVQLCEPYAKAKYAAADQLAAIEPILRREFPHLFDDKPPPGVEAPRTRSAAPQKRGVETYADMPKVHKEIADDLLDRGLIKDKEMYARNYFAQTAKG